MKVVECTKYGPPEVLKLAEAIKPVSGKGEVLVNIKATAVTASDCIIRGYKVPYHLWIPMGLAIGFTRPRRPVLGMVFAGEVEAVGEGVKSFAPGDKVFGCDFDRFLFGMYSEYISFPVEGTICKMPENMDFEQAASLPYGGLLALHFLRKARVAFGDDVLVYGASGAIGSAAVQLAKAMGAKVTAVCGPSNQELVKSLGADLVIDYTQEDFTSRPERYDLILNAVGLAKAKLDCKKALKPGGRHMTVDDGNPGASYWGLALLKELAEAERLQPVIDRVYPMERIADAHAYVDRGHKKGNVIIAVGA